MLEHNVIADHIKLLLRLPCTLVCPASPVCPAIGASRNTAPISALAAAIEATTLASSGATFCAASHWARVVVMVFSFLERVAASVMMAGEEARPTFG
ncbi:hypothetical protein N8D56_20885 [Devosia sp. A8/3-2]|nr:hypothetical protein N8D56_20885 [Devosia sp. A8/3-2]